MILDETALNIVCIERVPMKLRRRDLVEAVRRLSAKGLEAWEIGQLVKCRADSIGRIQRAHNIPPAPHQWTWYQIYLTPEQRIWDRERRRRYAARNRAAKQGGSPPQS